MDEVLQQMQAAAISQTEDIKSCFENLYKNKGRTGNQEERRRYILETQKDSRKAKLDKFRGILELVQDEDNIFVTPKTHWKPSIYVAGFTKVANYSDVLMMSEWLYEKPNDFVENWLAAPCPKGTRTLLIAHKGTTKCFNKYGKFKFECRTALPGGNPFNNRSNRGMVVLDCFHHKDSNTMYVLDILAWNECVMTEGEASFRHFWLISQLEQIPELELITTRNKMYFKIIPKVRCDTESLSKLLMIYPHYNYNSPPVDGLLFFHEKAQYFAGETPLVGWLYPYMVPEVLGADIRVNKRYLLQRPVDYIDYMYFIEKFENKSSRKKQKKAFGPKNMDTEADTLQGDDIAATGPINGAAEASALLCNDGDHLEVNPRWNYAVPNDNTL